MSGSPAGSVVGTGSILFLVAGAVASGAAGDAELERLPLGPLGLGPLLSPI